MGGRKRGRLAIMIKSQGTSWMGASCAAAACGSGLRRGGGGGIREKTTSFPISSTHRKRLQEKDNKQAKF